MRRVGELSITEAAELLEVHEDTVRRWAQSAVSGEWSRLPSARVDVVGRYWIPRDDVHALLEQNRQKNASAI